MQTAMVQHAYTSIESIGAEQNLIPCVYKYMCGNHDAAAGKLVNIWYCMASGQANLSCFLRYCDVHISCGPSNTACSWPADLFAVEITAIPSLKHCIMHPPARFAKLLLTHDTSGSLQSLYNTCLLSRRHSAYGRVVV